MLFRDFIEARRGDFDLPTAPPPSGLAPREPNERFIGFDNITYPVFRRLDKSTLASLGQKGWVFLVPSHHKQDAPIEVQGSMATYNPLERTSPRVYLMITFGHVTEAMQKLNKLPCDNIVADTSHSELAKYANMALKEIDQYGFIVTSKKIRSSNQPPPETGDPRPGIDS